MEKALKKKIENWLYRYDNYTTMMSSKKDYDRGVMARDLADELLKLIKGTTPLDIKE